MAMTYLESAALMSDQDFRGRVKVACLKYANSILIEPATAVAHTSRLKWANSVFLSPEMVAQQVQPPTVMDVQVQADGPEISDASLQIAVEVTADKMM